MSLQDIIINYTGIESVLVADFITAIVFGVGLLMIVGILTKFIFRVI